MLLQILINFLLAMEYGQLSIEVHCYPHLEGRSSSPLLINGNHIFLTSKVWSGLDQTRRIGSQIWKQKKKKLKILKTRFTKGETLKFPPNSNEERGIATKMAHGLNRGVARSHDSNRTLHRSPRILSSQMTSHSLSLLRTPIEFMIWQLAIHIKDNIKWAKYEKVRWLFFSNSKATYLALVRGSSRWRFPPFLIIDSRKGEIRGICSGRFLMHIETRHTSCHLRTPKAANRLFTSGPSFPASPTWDQRESLGFCSEPTSVWC